MGGARVTEDAVVSGADVGRGVSGDEGDEDEDEDAVRCNGCFVVHLYNRFT